MKKAISLLVLFGMLFCANNVESQSLLPPLEIGESITVRTEGYTHIMYHQDKESKPERSFMSFGNDYIQWKVLRLRTKVETSTPLGAFLKTNVLGMDTVNSNWLEEAWLSWDLNDDWQIRTGRLALSTLYVTPPPFLLETVQYPRMSRNVYGYGIQLYGSAGKGLDVIADMGGASGKGFNDSENWNRMEFSARVKKSFSDNFFIAGNTQLSEDFKRFIFDFGFNPTEKIYLKGAAYAADEGKFETYGNYVFAGYRILEQAELHTQTDYQINRPGNENIIWTNGVRVWEKNNQFALTIDYETIFGDKASNQLMMRLQYRF